MPVCLFRAGLQKGPREKRYSSRMVPLKYQNNPKMRERETMYIISLHSVDPLIVQA